MLTERGLFRLDGENAVQIAAIADQVTPFVVSDFFCSAPLAVFRNELYAGSQRNGALYRFSEQ